jgi:hypothetical protein
VAAESLQSHELLIRVRCIERKLDEFIASQQQAPPPDTLAKEPLPKRHVTSLKDEVGA